MAKPRPAGVRAFNFERLSDGNWSATAETRDGPVTAIGNSIGKARIALDQLLAIARAVEVTRRHHR